MAPLQFKGFLFLLGAIRFVCLAAMADTCQSPPQLGSTIVYFAFDNIHAFVSHLETCACTLLLGG